MNKRLKSVLKAAVKLLVTTAALYYVFSKVEWQSTWNTIKTANVLYLVAAMVFFTLSKVVSSFRLNIYFKNTGVQISERENLKLYGLGMFYNLSLPGGIGGDGYKVYLIGKNFKVKTITVFWAVMLDRAIGVLALFCLAVVFFLFVPVKIAYHYYTVLLIPVSLAITYVVIKRFFAIHLNHFFKTNMQSLLVQLLQLVCAWFILVSMKQSDQLLSYLLVFLVSSIVAVLPFTIGGAGARELAFLAGSQLLGLEQAVSIALSLLFYAITVMVSMAGMYFVFKPVRLSD